MFFALFYMRESFVHLGTTIDISLLNTVRCNAGCDIGLDNYTRPPKMYRVTHFRKTYVYS